MLSRSWMSQGRWVRRLVSLLLPVLIVAGCSDDTAPVSPAQGDAVTANPVEDTRLHQAPYYVWPMHPQIARNAPGACPICGMDPVARETGTAARPEVKITGIWSGPDLSRTRPNAGGSSARQPNRSALPCSTACWSSP